MTEDHQLLNIERILVALDCSAHSFAALQAAIQISRHFNLELDGLFIEDLAVLNLAQSPFHQEIGDHTATIREISINGIQQSVLIQSRRVVQTFKRLTREEDIRGHISVVRGKVLNTISKVAQDYDLVIIGKSGTSYFFGKKFGSTAQALIQKTHKPLLLLENGNMLGYPLIVLYHNSPHGQTCLEIAHAFLSEGETLVILLAKDNEQVYQKNLGQIKAWAAEKNIIVTFQTYKKGRLEHIFQLLQGVKTGLLILPNLQQNPEKLLIRKLLDRMDMPVMLISKEKVKA